ncbi:Bax inhibitor-1/YccA family membrane protein [Rothia sp. P7181]|uniref:Bax inhibitor-1/YccA family protein n=1 Tax=unclassified Rothia (in: high G+C Gram-positive bacteria) TaxID=2689056 RepID=UPI003AD5B8BA
MAGNPLINSMLDSQKKDSRFGQFGAGGAYSNGQSSSAPYGYTPTSPREETPTAADLNAMYQSPSATSAQTGQMTMNDVIVKVAINFVILLVGAAASVMFPILVVAGLVGSIVLGLVNGFKKEVSPVLVMAYALAQGMLLGGFSAMAETRYPGIVGQAVLATFIVFGTVLVLFRNGKLRESPKMTKFFTIAAISYAIFCLVNLGMTLFGGTNVRSIEVMGIPLGLIIGLFAVALCVYSLILDFTHVSEAVRYGAPERESWRMAFALTSSLVWLYIEILRILMYVREMMER